MAENNSSSDFTPALGYNILTPLYDITVSVTCREGAFKQQLVSNLFNQSQKENSNLDILDVACGTGTLMTLLWQESQVRSRNIKLVGLDIDPIILQRAAHKLTQELPDNVWQLEQSPSTKMPFSDASFDHVVTSLFFHHLKTEDKRDTLKQMYRVLKPGGMLHIADWTSSSNKMMRLLFYGVQILDGFETTADNVNGMLPILIEQAGFKNIALVSTFDTIHGTIGIYTACRE